ncbi:ligand-gated channel [Bacteroidia bacterium]|nr:ligand-gated channel [Bacteroidia bacterium]
MNMKRISVLVSALLWAGVSTLFAENAAEAAAADTFFLDEVVVSATKTEVTRGKIPLTISVVNRETIEESTETGVLSILSEQIPGVFVTERGVTGYGISSGSAGTVNIHGVGGGNRVLMLFDGQPNWAGIFGHHLPDAYVASDAERVEVIRGPGSLLYGSNAMGGIINVITRKATKDGIHGNGRVMYGSYDTWKFMGSSGYKKDKFNAYVSLNRDQSDGHRDNSAFYINNGYVKLGYEISDNWNVSGNAIIADFKVNNPGAIDAPAIENWAEALRSTYSVAINNKYEKVSGSIQAFYNDGAHKINDGWRNGAPRPYLFRSSDYNRGIAVFESFSLLEGNLFTVGLDAKQWGGHAWNDSINGNKGEIIDKTVNEIAGYAVVQQTFFDKLTVNAGIRLENNEGYGNEWVPQAGIAYQLSGQTAFKASASKGFRSPNLRELYMYAPANPALKPENLNNYDFSYVQSLWDNKLQLELTAYYASGENLITTTMVDGKPLNVNTDKFTNKGVDFAVAYQILPNLKASGNYSFLDSDIKITAAPKHKAFLGVHWAINKFTIAPNFQYVDGLYLGTVDDEDVIDNYALVNCKVSYKATDWLNLFISGENLTDTSYQTYLGFPMPGAVVLGGVDVRF